MDHVRPASSLKTWKKSWKTHGNPWKTQGSDGIPHGFPHGSPPPLAPRLNEEIRQPHGHCTFDAGGPGLGTAALGEPQGPTGRVHDFVPGGGVKGWGWGGVGGG